MDFAGAATSTPNVAHTTAHIGVKLRRYCGEDGSAHPRHTRNNIVRLGVLLSLLLLTQAAAFAQLAPTGSHYAGRSSDTGYAGEADVSGGTHFSSIPFEFPTARHGLSIPLSVINGRKGLGAAGVDWDVPLSIIRRDRTLAHRRPTYGANVLPVAPERISLTLLGQSLELVQFGTGWVARDGNPRLVAHEIAGGDWIVENGDGKTFRFVQPPQLRNAGIWLLKSIVSADRVEMELSYQLDGTEVGGALAQELNLVRISYNRHPIANCFKNTIALGYTNPTDEPLSVSMFGEVALARRRTLEQIDVYSRAGCTTPPQRIRRYSLRYGSDADTRQPRLLSVRLFGRQGTTEANSSLPVASYEYGSATRAGIPNFTRVLRYERTQTIALPGQADLSKLSGTSIESAGGDPGPRYTMWQSILDVTGDGRPELVFRKDNKLWMALNRPAPGGNTTLGLLQGSTGVIELSDATFAAGPLAMHIATSPRYAYNVQVSVDDWRQAIDVNGDGRVDVIDAKSVEGAWVIYLNTPGGSSGVIWKRRLFSTAAIAQDLAARGHILAGNRVPLSRRTSGSDALSVACWRWVAGGHEWTAAPLNTCPNGTEPSDNGLTERTYVEWELSDLNGDGYPDLVFNSTPVRLRPGPFGPPPAPEEEARSDILRRVEYAIPFGPDKTNRLRAAFNMVGVRLGEGPSRPFTRSVDLQLNAFNELGVGAWANSGNSNQTSSEQHKIAGFTDINGDGLQDRIVHHVAYIGAFHGTARFFSSIGIRLPGNVAVQRNTHPESCSFLDNGTYPSELIAGLRDFTGDGIPDYFHRGSVHIGTGVSFTPPVPIQGAPASFSVQQETCDGETSNVTRGVFDIDGDGKPDMLVLEGQSLFVYQLASGTQTRSPQAGMLIAVENGYGARTELEYISAKEDASSAHQTALPEIVVNKIRTTGPAGLLSDSRFAYGGAETIFDPLRDRFLFPGYQRQVSLKLYTVNNRPQAIATVGDAWPMLPFTSAMTESDRWLRVRRVGLPRDTYSLRGSGELDPWRLLGVDAQDPRVVGITHHEWGAKLFPADAQTGASPADCVEMTDAYDFEQSALSNMPNGLDICRARGFSFQRQQDSWYGSQPPPSTSNVQTRWRALEVDDLGRTTLVRLDNDVRRGDDDICVAQAYATPITNSSRRLTSMESRRVSDCEGRRIFASERWKFDDLAMGQVGRGRVTSHMIDRHATNDGELLGSIRVFAAEYDDLGNPISLRSERGSHERVQHLNYDPFGLVATRIKVEATGAPAMTTNVVLDAISMQPISQVDFNLTERGIVYDGLGRPVQATVRPPGGQLGVVSTAKYDGFNGDPQGRRITIRKYADPVAPDQTENAVGSTGTLFFDPLDRPLRGEIELGADYQDAVLVSGARTYDLLGRVAFIADEHVKGADPQNVYGTSFHFKDTGDIDCIIRGFGPQPLSRTTDKAAERFPVCFTYLTSGGTHISDMSDPASLDAASPQGGTIQRTVSSAIGRPLERSTIKEGNRLDHATIAYDRLGQMIAIKRYLDPVAAASPVEFRRRMDSLGQVLSLSEPDSAERTFAYSDWGELTENSWQDGATVRRVVNGYDGLRRLTSTREFAGNIEDIEARKSYQYDQGLVLTAAIHPTYVLGRLSGTRFASGQVAFSYDAFGNMEAEVHTDRNGTAYIQQSSFSADGKLNGLQFNLPDQAYKVEKAKYEYDSARRLRRVTYGDELGDFDLYRAGTIDVLGRVREARFGQGATYHADFANSGRSLLNSMEVATSSGSRRFGNFNYDALGRRILHTEYRDGASGGRTSGVLYDTLGRLAGAVQIEGSALTTQVRFTYDALGNLIQQEDMLGGDDVAALYSSVDRDRICRVEYGAGTPTSNDCNFMHDAVGNVISQPTRAGSRQLSYFNSGAVRTIEQGSSPPGETPATARFAYDAFGNVSELDVEGVDAAGGARRDRRFGALLERRAAQYTGDTLYRKIPGPGGLLATRGGNGEWIFSFGEARGARFFVDQHGRFIQNVDYKPFGTAISTGAPIGTAQHSTRQWNDGDVISAFEISHLGARLYDPVIGRFLSRDPVAVPRSASSTNPYAFALNDPVNRLDRTGLDPGCIGQECQGLDWFSGLKQYAGSSYSNSKAETNFPATADGTYIISLESWNAMRMSLGYESCLHIECWTGDWAHYSVPDDPFMSMGPLGILAAWESLDTPLAKVVNYGLMATGIVGIARSGFAWLTARGLGARMAGAELSGLTGAELTTALEAGEAAAAGGERIVATYGPYAHKINKGGLNEIIETQRLLSTAGRPGYGDAVRASMAPPGRIASEGFFAENETMIIFRTYRPPTSYNWPQEYAFWDIPAGEYEPIILDAIHLAY